MAGSSFNYILTTLLILFSIPSNIDSVSAGRLGPTTNTEFIRKSCITTIYPQLCFSSLSIHANAIKKSPKLLAHTAFSLTLNSTKSTSAIMVRFSHSHFLKPKEAAAMADCVQELGDSVNRLSNSLREMSQLRGPNFNLMISDIQTWVSAALTDDDTCMDGFAGDAMNGRVKNVVRGRIVNLGQLTSNALALINNYASLHV